MGSEELAGTDRGMTRFFRKQRIKPEGRSHSYPARSGGFSTVAGRNSDTGIGDNISADKYTKDTMESVRYAERFNASMKNSGYMDLEKVKMKGGIFKGTKCACFTIISNGDLQISKSEEEAS